MTIEAKKVATAADFSVCPIWRYDDEDDLYHPVMVGNELPESERSLSTRAMFTAPDGKSFDGYVVGIERVFSFGLFGGRRTFHVNMNLLELSRKQLEAFIQTQPCMADASVEALFPLEFRTTINHDAFVDFGGRFECLGKAKLPPP